MNGLYWRVNVQLRFVAVRFSTGKPAALEWKIERFQVENFKVRLFELKVVKCLC